MTAQIIPFQTQEHRTLANAYAYYHFYKDEYTRSGGSVSRKSTISIAVYAAAADERWGRDWRDDPEIKKAMDKKDGDRISDAIYGRLNFERNRWDQYSRRLELQLGLWLDGRLQRLRQRQPLRPPRRRIKSDAPLAQIIPFPVRCPEQPGKAAEG